MYEYIVVTNAIHYHILEKKTMPYIDLLLHQIHGSQAPTRLPLRRLPIVAFKNEPRDQLTSQSTDIGRYLSTALVNIFRPTHTAKDVKFMVQPFTGRVSHR